MAMISYELRNVLLSPNNQKLPKIAFSKKIKIDQSAFRNLLTGKMAIWRQMILKSRKF